MTATVAAVDVGTSSVKLLLADASGRPVGSWRRPLLAAKLCPAPGMAELRPLVLLDAVRSLFADAAGRLGGVEDLLLCGQMHGIVLWRSDNRLHCTNCVTWQDARCDAEFLASLPPVSDAAFVQPKSGFGLATLLWWQRHTPELVSSHNRCGSSADWLASSLAGAADAPMSAQMAASWGYFDAELEAWDTSALASCRLPLALPPIAGPGTVVGVAANGTGAGCGLPAGCRIRVALGDLQCAVYSVCRQVPGAAFVNFGTSAQLGFVANSASVWRQAPQQYAGLDCFPYFSGCQRLLLAASLNGGDVLAAFVRLLADWRRQLDGGVAEEMADEAIWLRLEQLAAECDEDTGPGGSGPTVVPLLHGERHRPHELGRVGDISPDNCRSLGRVYWRLCLGLAANLASMCPPPLLLAAGAQSVALAGGQLLGSGALQRACRRALAPIECRPAGQHCDAVDGLVAHFVDCLLPSTA